MSPVKIDEDLLELLVSLVEDDIESRLLEIISKYEEEDIVIEELIKLLEKENNDKD